MSRIVLGVLFASALTAPTCLAADLPTYVRIADSELRAQVKVALAADLRREQPTWSLRRCSRVVSYTPPMPTGHDSSWGAACTVSVGGTLRASWFCDDWYVGKFRSAPDQSASGARLGEFVARSCPPGG